MRSPSSAHAGGEGRKAYLDGSHNAWAHSLGIAVVVLDLTALPVLLFMLWRRRGFFPLNSTPTFLLLWTQLGASLYVFSLLQSIVAPTMPCWLHIFLSVSDGFPFFSGSACQLFNAWFVSELKQSVALGKKNVFTKRCTAVSEGSLRTLFLLAAVIFGILPFVLQLAGRPSAVLSGSMMQAECLTYFSKAEKWILRVLWWVPVSLNVLFAYLMRHMKDAFNLKENWKSILYFFVLGAPLNAMANVTTGLDDTIRINTYVVGQFAFVCAGFSYMWFASILPLKRSMEEDEELRKSKNAAASYADSGPSATKRNSMTIGAIPTLIPVSTTKDLRLALQRQDVAIQFQLYLVREFAVENMLFIQALRELRAITDRESRVSRALEISRDFIREGSPSEINIKDDLRRELLRKIDSSERKASSSSSEDIDINIFNPAEDQVLQMMIDPYNRFIRLLSDPASKKRSMQRRQVTVIKPAQ